MRADGIGRASGWLVACCWASCWLGMSGCSELAHGCTLIGCNDGVRVELAFAERPWPEGAYRIELRVDDNMPTECSWELPAALPTPGTVRLLDCAPTGTGLRVSLEQASDCREERTGDAVTLRCSPVAGRFKLDVQVDGTPRRFGVRLERDGSAVTEQDLPLVYHDEQPNGPDCDPTCKRSAVAIRLD